MAFRNIRCRARVVPKAAMPLVATVGAIYLIDQQARHYGEDGDRHSHELRRHHTAASTTATSTAACDRYFDDSAARRQRLYHDVGESSSSTSSTKIQPPGPDSDYPNFQRHGPHSLIAKHLPPEVYEKLKHKKTRFGVTLDGMIQAGVALPWGASPPRGIGVYAGDAECYKVFSPFLRPILEEYHGSLSHDETGNDGTLTRRDGKPQPQTSPQSQAVDRQIRKVRLQRQVTNLNPAMVFPQPIDPTGEYILYTRMRVSRSLKKYAFPPAISRQQRRQVEKLLAECVDQDFENGEYRSIMEMSNAEHNDLIQRHILFKDPDAYANLAGLGRDWPDGRGLYCDNFKSPKTIIWCNDNDHFRIISMQKGGSLQSVFTNMTRVLGQLESALAKRGHGFCTDPHLGFLNTSPTNCGTGLRASVFVKLVLLGQQPGFDDLLRRMKLEASTRFNENDNRYTGIFDIANAERLGRSEVELINTMIDGVAKLIQLEKRLERGEIVDLNEVEASG